MISQDDLRRIEAYGAAIDPSLPFFSQSPNGGNGGTTQGGAVAPGGSIVGDAKGTGNSNVNQSHAGIFGMAPTPTQNSSNEGISFYSKFLSYLLTSLATGFLLIAESDDGSYEDDDYDDTRCPVLEFILASTHLDSSLHQEILEHKKAKLHECVHQWIATM